MNPSMKAARVAGLLYLMMVFTGLFNLIYVPSKLIVRGNAAETASNLVAHESLVRIDLVVGLVTTVIFMFVVLVLYRLLKEVNHQLAALMVILVLVQIPNSFASQLCQIGALELARGADFLSAIDKPHRDALALLCLHLNGQGSFLSELFWGLWLFPLGLLVFRSGFLPRFIGVWLLINGVAYVVLSVTGLLLPQHVGLLTKISYPALFGEVALTFWLLIMGARPKPTPA